MKQEQTIKPFRVYRDTKLDLAATAKMFISHYANEYLLRFDAFVVEKTRLN